MCPAEEGTEPPTSTSLMLYFILLFQKSNQIADFILFYRKVNKNQVENAG